MSRFNSICHAAMVGIGALTLIFGIAAPWSLATQDAKQLSLAETVTSKATIVTIDRTTRVVTLRGPNGNEFPVYADESVKRFDQLKVGDQVTATFSESVAVSVRKPGGPAPEKVKETIVPREGKPGGTVTRERTLSVTVQEIDLAAPSLTFKGLEGRTVTYRVADKNNLKDLKVGDQVDITYTESMLLQVEAAR